MTFLRCRIFIACMAVALAQPRTLSDLKKIQENAALESLDKMQVKAALKTISEIMQAPKAASYTTHPETSACFQDVHLHIKKGVASLLQDHNVPGAGVDKFKPFEKVLKDGFLAVECVKDNMYYNGDKFGDNKHDYKLGFPGVSIVHFDAFVAKEDQGEMTQKKCFEFCRTVPNMGFFGIVNGRQCYCTPYYTAMESDSEMCDAVCEGDNTQVCGGESKSSIFAMHMCDSTKEDLRLRSNKAGAVNTEVDAAVKRAKLLSGNMQAAAAKLQKSFGAVGDSGATDLMQSAKVFAGDLVHKAEDAEAVAATLGELSASASSLKRRKDFGDPATVTKAERVMEGLDDSVAKGVDVFHELATLESWAVGEHEVRKFDLGAEIKAKVSGPEPPTAELIISDTFCAGPIAHFMITDLASCVAKILSTPEDCQGGWFDWGPIAGCYCQRSGDCTDRGSSPLYTVYNLKEKPKEMPALKQYHPVMYFVDKQFVNVPSTCNGPLAAKPITAKSADGCAAACDANIHNCVGFQHFKDGKNDLCFLFSSFATGVYYTGCGKAFLQAEAAPFEATCYAKLSRFEGTTLKPNPSGKCEKCFKKLTKADRCYK